MAENTDNKIVFGASQFGKETPKWIATIYRVVMFLTLLWMTAIEPRVGLSDQLAHNIDVLLAISSISIYLFCQCFGYKAPDQIRMQGQELTSAQPSLSAEDVKKLILEALNAVAPPGQKVEQ